MTQKRILLWSIGFITVAIILGAFGAHALKERISAERLLSFETGVRYQMYHGLALIAIAVMCEKWTFSFRLPGKSFNSWNFTLFYIDLWIGTSRGAWYEFEIFGTNHANWRIDFDNWLGCSWS